MLTKLLPKKIDTYVVGEVFGPFFGGVAFFTFVFLMFQILRLADFFIIHGVALPVLGRMTGLMILSSLPSILPISFLIGVLVGFGRLSSDSELVAMKANGISVTRLSVPVVILSLFVVGISLGLNMTWVPWGDRTFKSLLIRVSNTRVASSIKEGTFTSGFFDLLIFADKYDNKTNRMHHVFLFDEREAKNPLAVIAQEGEIVQVKTDSLGSAAMLRLYKGSIHNNQVGDEAYNRVLFDEYRLFLKIEEGADTATVKPRMIPYGHLRDERHKHLEWNIEFWRRWSVGFAPLIFVFLGIGFGTVRTRAVRAGAALISFIVVLVYWGVQAWTTIAAQKGLISPFFAMQIPNMIMGVIAYRGFKTAMW